jgi:hypothetical protein
MYGIRTQLLIVFITHPYILLPIPGPGMFSWLRGLWQASWVTGLCAFSEGKYSFWAEGTFAFCFLVWVAVQLKPYMSN